jgi:hypothetical protein
LPLDRLDRRIAPGEEHIRAERDQFCRLASRERGVGARPAPVDVQVDALFPAERTEPLREGGDDVVAEGCGEEADPPHSARLLRARSKGPSRHRAAKNTEKFAPPHVQPHAQDERSYRVKLSLR